MSPSPLRLLSLLALASVLTGCGDAGGDGGVPPPRDVAAPGSPRVVLGTGTANFEPIPEVDGEMELVAGPQGGWHLNATVRLFDMTVERAMLGYAIRRDGERISMPVEYRLTEARLVREGGGWLRAGDRIVFAIGDPSEVVGTVVEVEVTATPPDGPTVSDARTVTVVDEE